jgi:hypothetical protein
MSKPFKVEPHRLHILLMHWSRRSSNLMSSPLGYPGTCPYLKERTAARTESLEPWDLTTADHDELALCIAGLDRRHCLAITRAYKPWTIQSIAHDLGMYHVTDRTWRTWAHAAALELAEKMGMLDHV